MNDSHQSSDPNQTLADTSVGSATTPFGRNLARATSAGPRERLLAHFPDRGDLSDGTFRSRTTAVPAPSRRQSDEARRRHHRLRTDRAKLRRPRVLPPATFGCRCRDTMRLLRAERISAQPTQSSKTERRMTRQPQAPMNPSPVCSSWQTSIASATACRRKPPFPSTP